MNQRYAIALAVAAACAGALTMWLVQRQPASYERCILSRVAPSASPAAAGAIVEACKALYPRTDFRCLIPLDDDAMSSVSGRSRITAQRFDGTFYNGLSSDTVVELTIGIAALGQRDTIGRLYRVPTNVPPLGTQQVSFPILEDPAAQREWTIVEAKVTETDEQKCYEHLISSFSGQ